jgi:hypothetical protein
MTTTLSVKGQLVIPQPVRDRQKLKAGTDFTVITRRESNCCRKARNAAGLAARCSFSLRITGTVFLLTTNTSDFFQVETLDPWLSETSKN